MDLLIDRELGNDGILAAFTTRVGGVSAVPFDSLNLARETGDDPELVKQNRILVSEALSIDHGGLVFPHQVHGARVVWAGWGEAGAGVLPEKPTIAGTDGLATRLPGVNLVILTADCLPLIFADPKLKLTAVVHAGWRGTLAKISAEAIRLLVEAGSTVDRIQARLGPSIRGCCYEVGADVYDSFAADFSLARPGGKRHLDLADINKRLLLDIGLKSANIRDVELCTACRPDLFYSWRRAKVTGRQAAITAIVPG
jgi:polyphenol oxidase